MERINWKLGGRPEFSLKAAISCINGMDVLIVDE